MKREDSKIKFVENHPCPLGYKCHCGKILKHWNPSVLLNNIRLHLEVKTLITGWLLAWQMHACMCHGTVHGGWWWSHHLAGALAVGDFI